MRKVCAVFALAILMLGLTGCSSSADSRETIQFYYVRNSYEYGAADGVIAAEAREITDNRNDPKYLLSLYFQGPQDQSLRLPFPPSVILTNVQVSERTIIVTLNADVVKLNELDLNIAYACLAKTCVCAANVDTVIIESRVTDGSFHISKTITADQLMAEPST